MRVLAGIVLTVAIALAAAGSAQAEVVWLCKPGEEPNPCRESQETTVYAEDGSSRVENPPNHPSPPVDCFYVYPTVSGQQSTNADKSKDDELYAIARYQAARYSTQCRVFAPVYRQLTLASIYTGSQQARAEGRKIAYGDVREAWLEYLARHNDGRGVVLIGHSQGTGMLRQLIRDEVDPKPGVRRRLVSALLLGGNVAVRKGSNVGGDFQQVPGCTSPTDLGCVVAYSIYDEEPPDNTRFGKVPATDTTGAGLPAGAAFEVLCTNPGSLGANAPSTFTGLLRSEPFPGSIGAALVIMYGGPAPTAPTPWLQPADRYAGRCEQSNGANVLMVRPVGESRELNASPTPDWGLHLADANLPLAGLVELVKSQAAAYVATSPAERARAGTAAAARCRRTVTLTVRRVRGLRLRRVEAYVGSRRVAVSRTRRVRVTITGATRVRLRVTSTRRGRTVRALIHRTLRGC